MSWGTPSSYGKVKAETAWQHSRDAWLPPQPPTALDLPECGAGVTHTVYWGRDLIPPLRDVSAMSVTGEQTRPSDPEICR